MLSCCLAIKSCVKLHGHGWTASTVEDKQLVHLIKSQSQRQLGQSNKRLSTPPTPLTPPVKPTVCQVLHLRVCLRCQGSRNETWPGELMN